MNQNLQSLATVLDGFPGLKTTYGQDTEDQWQLSFEVQHTEEGWRSLEFVAWAVSDLKQGGNKVILEAIAIPPYLNTPGECLLFVVKGKNDAPEGSIRPQQVASILSDWKEDYVPVGE